MDEKAEDHLRKLALPCATLIPLGEVETDRLRAVKPDRSKGEYCWTLTPFLPGFVLDRDPSIERVTYVDADLFFFRSPAILLDELPAGAHTLITEHAFDPEYDQASIAGRFCVQFLTFRNSAPAREILAWWQDRCIEWCFSRHENGKFGDQKYLDQWPDLFGDKVHILEQKNLALAPWNADFFLQGEALPVFYHFHGLRLITATRARLFTGYHIGRRGRALYREYVKALGRSLAWMQRSRIEVPFFPEKWGAVDWLRALRLRLLGRRATAKIIPVID